MTPTQNLQAQVVAAMKAHDTIRLDSLRYLLAQVKNAEIDKPGHEPLTEDEFVKVVRKLVANTEDAVSQFAAGGRQDLVDAEAPKLAVWKAFLPQEMSDDDLQKIVVEVLASTDQKMPGPIIGEVMKRMGAQADGKRVSSAVMAALRS